MEKTIILLGPIILLEDYLHIRGENALTGHNNTDEVGSPPHTWRKPGLWRVSLPDDRITSTYVEKTIIAFFDAFASQDHLHIRGENTRY